MRPRQGNILTSDMALKQQHRTAILNIHVPNEKFLNIPSLPPPPQEGLVYIHVAYISTKKPQS